MRRSVIPMQIKRPSEGDRHVSLATAGAGHAPFRLRVSGEAVGGDLMEGALDLTADELRWLITTAGPAALAAHAPLSALPENHPDRRAGT